MENKTQKTKKIKMRSKAFFVLMFLAIGTWAGLIEPIQAQVLQQWTHRYNGPSDSSDAANNVTVDSYGNVYVTGYSTGSGTSYDYATVKYNPSGVVQWAQRYNGPASLVDEAASIAVDGSGNIYVTGRSFGNGTGYDIATIKYNSSGIQQWVQRYNVQPFNGDEHAYDIALDGSGNVYVAGSGLDSTGTNADFLTIKYNSSGVLEWAKRYNGPGNGVDSYTWIALGGSGTVYVTGTSLGAGTNYDYATICYNSSGVQQWVQRYLGPGNNYDGPNGIAVDGSGNIYVTGASMGSGTGYDYATIKYSPSGAELWVQRYNGPLNSFDYGNSIAVDGPGNVYVTGSSAGSGTSYDFATIKYNTSGVQQWAQRYNGPANNYDNAASIAVDAAGNVYAAGRSMGNGTGMDFATIKYSPSGVQQWAQRYSGAVYSTLDAPSSIALDASGNVFVSGYTQYDSLGTHVDFCTIRYTQTPLAPSNLTAAAVSQSKINLQWTDNSGNEYGFKIERSTNAGTNWIFKDSVGSNTTAYADSGLASNTIYHYRIYAYNLAGSSPYSNTAFDTTFNLTGIVTNGEIPKEYKLYNNYPNPFNPATNIRFSIPGSGIVKLAVYDILGKEAKVLVNENLNAGTYNISFDASGLSSGIYFYRIEVRQSGSSASGFTAVKKMILVK